MANTKAKIIIGGGIVLLGGFITWRVLKNVKQNKIKKSILAQINDPKNIGATVSGNEAHKYTKGLDPNFWKKTKGSPLPTGLIPDRKAREYAKKIYDNIGSWTEWKWNVWDNENEIMSALKNAPTQGAMSQIAHQFEAMGYGNLADRLEDSLQEGTFEKDRLKELNNYINSLPF